MLHHTAGAATESTNPKAAGNQTGANAGIINYIHNHFRVPAANFTLDRDGRVYVHSAYPVWHAGAGTFKGRKPWGKWLESKPGRGNDYMMGVEIVSRGRRKDFTKAQIDAVAKLQEAVGEAAKWPAAKRRAKVRRPKHSDWTTRKIDILYSHREIDKWMK
jgi:N-acetyl-anhydromuramyl-L-alanine amidase AmpD